MLSDATLAQLTVQQREKYARLEKLFASDGWKDVMSWAYGYAEDQNGRMMTAANWDTYLLARGATAAFSALMNLESTTLAEFEALAVENKDEAITLDEIAHE